MYNTIRNGSGLYTMKAFHGECFLLVTVVTVNWISRLWGVSSTHRLLRFPSKILQSGDSCQICKGWECTMLGECIFDSFPEYRGSIEQLVAILLDNPQVPSVTTRTSFAYPRSSTVVIVECGWHLRVSYCRICPQFCHVRECERRKWVPYAAPVHLRQGVVITLFVVEIPRYLAWWEV